MRAGSKARRFHARAIPTHAPEATGSCTVSVLDCDTEVGRYERNMLQFAEQTFEPFESNGSWYALYSRDYTAMRVMSLPDCRDLGGEEANPHGFCPVEFYVPRFKTYLTENDAGSFTEHWAFEAEAEVFNDNMLDVYGRRIKVGPWQSLDIGFVAGCRWGDDVSWKLEVVDLSRVQDGGLPRTPRFGHLQLAGKMGLAEAVRLHRWREIPLRATIFQEQDWDVASGQLIDPYQ